MTALHHPMVRADAHDPCPFCGCGPLAAIARPRKPKRVKSYRPCDCTFCTASRVGMTHHTTADIVAHMGWLGGNCKAIEPSAAAELSPEYQAHLDAGERAVPDVAAGGYRWEKGNAA